MFTNKKRPELAQAVHTLLGKGTLWRGEVVAGQNSLRIEGTIEGTIHSEGEVTVAPSGVVRGTINAKHLIVTGRVEGTFKIEECLEIHGTGCVEGEVELGSLVVDEGGTLQGNCTRRGVAKKPTGALNGTPVAGDTPVPAVAGAGARSADPLERHPSYVGANGAQDNPFGKTFEPKKG